MKLIEFIIASSLLTLLPGPDILFVLTQSMIHGRKAGISVALGLCSGLFVHTAAAAFGLSLIISSSPTLFAIIKYAGILYLLWMGYASLRGYYKQRNKTTENKTAPLDNPVPASDTPLASTPSDSQCTANQFNTPSDALLSNSPTHDQYASTSCATIETIYKPDQAEATILKSSETAAMPAENNNRRDLSITLVSDWCHYEPLESQSDSFLFGLLPAVYRQTEYKSQNGHASFGSCFCPGCRRNLYLNCDCRSLCC